MEVLDELETRTTHPVFSLLKEGTSKKVRFSFVLQFALNAISVDQDFINKQIQLYQQNALVDR